MATITQTGGHGGGGLSSVPDLENRCYVNVTNQLVTFQSWTSFDPTSGVETTHQLKVLASDDPAYSVGQVLTAVPAGLTEVPCVSGGGLSTVPDLEQRCYVNTSGELLRTNAWSSFDPATSAETIHRLQVLISEDVSILPGSILTAVPAGFTETFCPAEVATVDPNLPVVTCYTRLNWDDEPTNATNDVANKGYSTRKIWTAAQFDQGVNAPPTDAGLNPFVVTDQDGLPTVNGEYVESNQATLSYSDAGQAAGLFYTWEGFVYIPGRYPDTAAGKKVIKFELVETSPTTTYYDYTQLWIAHDTAGKYSLQRSDLKLKIDNPLPASDPAYNFDLSQSGRWARFYIAVSDLGSGTNTNFRMRLTYDDGTIQLQNATNFISNLPEPVYHATTSQEIVQRVFDPVAGTTTWTPADVDPATDSLQVIPCANLPLSYSAFVDGAAGIVKINNAFGGDGGPYQYSIDGGATWQATDTFVIGDEIVEILPRIQDSTGLVSGQNSADVYRKYAGSTAFSINIVGADTSASFYDDGAGETGWNIDYSTELLNLNFTDEAAELPNWTFSGPNAAYINIVGNEIRLGQNMVNMGGMEGLRPLGATDVGELYTVAFDYRNYYYGRTAADTINIAFDVIDDVTNAVLAMFVITDDETGTGDATINQNSAQTSINNIISWSGTGNPVSFRITDASINTLPDANGHYGRVDNLRFYKGRYQTTTNYFRKNGNSAYILARGVDNVGTLTTDVIDVSAYDGDLIFKVDIRDYGSPDPGIDSFRLEYSLDGGAWQLIAENDGQSDQTDFIQFSDFYYDQGIPVTGVNTIQYRWVVFGNADSGDGYYLYEMSHINRDK